MATTINPNAVVLILDKVAGLIKVQDNTDYAALGVDFNAGDSIGGLITLRVIAATTQSQQILYDNTTPPPYDIVPATSPNNTIDIPLPLDSSGNILPGQYYFGYTIQGEFAIGGDITGYFELIQIYDYTFPEIKLEKQIKCDTSQLASRDITNYGIYATDIERVHTIYPPPASGKTLATTDLSLLIYTRICTKTWTQEVKSTVTFTFTDSFQVIALLTGSNEIVVDCSTDVCVARCCINKRINAYNYTKDRNPARAQIMWETIIQPALLLMVDFLMAQYCGNPTAASALLTQIKDITGCKGECNDCGDAPIDIIPSGAAVSLEYNVDSPDDSIDVQTEVIGNVVTFHTQISDIIQNIINNLQPVNVVAGTNITITSATVMGVLTFTVNSTGGVASIENEIVVLGQIYRNPTQPTPGGQAEYFFREIPIKLTGDGMQAPTYNLGTANPNTLSQYMVLFVTDFFTGVLDDDTPYAVNANIVRYASAGSYSQVKDIEAEIFFFDLTVPAFVVRFWNPIDGTARIFGDIIDKPDLYLKITIHAVKP